MGLRNLLASIFLYSTILAQSIPSYDAQQQQPLILEERLPLAKSYVSTVVLGLTERGNSVERYLRVPLGKRFPSGSTIRSTYNMGWH